MHTTNTLTWTHTWCEDDEVWHVLLKWKCASTSLTGSNNVHITTSDQDTFSILTCTRHSGGYCVRVLHTLSLSMAAVCNALLDKNTECYWVRILSVTECYWYHPTSSNFFTSNSVSSNICPISSKSDSWLIIQCSRNKFKDSNLVESWCSTKYTVFHTTTLKGSILSWRSWQKKHTPIFTKQSIVSSLSRLQLKSP